MKAATMGRRAILRGGLAGACSLAAHPWLSTMSFAAAPWDARLVVIILRGAMDGLDVVQPYGDPLLSGYRPGFEFGPEKGALDLDGYFAMHRRLDRLAPLWAAGELGFVHAVSTPYRDKRSHFDGQDLLEAGTGGSVLGAERDGWLNRLLQVVPGTRADTAFAVGSDEMRVLSGKAQAMRWSPDVDVTLTPQAQLLLERIYADDPLFAPAATEGMALAAAVDRETLPDLPGGGRREKLAAFAATRLLKDTRIAAYSLNGWDTHKGQRNGIGAALDRLQRSILTLREDLGGVWSKTAVLAMTEFGRTVRQNGTAGTDHGTGGAMVIAGGALRGGRVFGTWPGLADADLYQQRDLMPTGDVRSVAAWAMHGLFGLEKSKLENAVFPGLDMGRDPGIVR